MVSEAAICNMALLRTGVSETITDLTIANKQGRVCTIFYAPTRDAVLRAFDWNFARARRVLALRAGASATNWAYAYALPEDYLQARGLVVIGARIPKKSQQAPYEVAGRTLFTDLENAELIYTARVEDPSLFDPSFVNAFAWALVPDLAMGLAVKGDMATTARAAFRAIISEALADNLAEGEDREPDSDFITARN
jgi:hypothetical protein